MVNLATTTSWLNVVLLFAWLALIGIALLRLRYAPINDTSRALWALCILLVPILGPLAFLLVGAQPRQQRKA